MIELKIALDGVDYDTLIPKIVPKITKNKAAAGVTAFTIKAKMKNKSKAQQDALAVKFLEENKNKIIQLLNTIVKENGVDGYVMNFDADIIG